MYCKKCGTDLGNSTFCPNCGQPASVPEYDAEVVGGTKMLQIMNKQMVIQA